MTVDSRARLTGALLMAAVALAPFLGAYPVLAMKLMCFALFACAFNLLLGFTGLLSFGHAAFFGGAAYACGYVMKSLHATPELGLLAGMAFGALLGLAFGALAIRRQGIYFAMVTLALAQMFYFFCLQAPVTGGEDGLQAVPRGSLFGLLSLEGDLTMYYVVSIVVGAALLLIARVVNSPFGQVLRAIKENEPRAISLGYDTDRFKLLAFVLSSALAGLAGALKTLVLGFATLTDVHWAMSGSVILMTLVGGMGTLSGPILGALVIVAVENKLGDAGSSLAAMTGVDWFNTLGESVSMVTGLIFVVCVLTFRRGVMGEVQALLERRAALARPASDSAATPLHGHCATAATSATLKG